MYHKSRGIVLHTTKYSETSIIARIYTEKFGLLSFMVKGVRSAKSKSKASMMQPLSLLDLEFQYHENRGLLYIKEFNRARTYLSLPFDTLKITVAMFLLEVVTKSIQEHEANDELFDFVYSALYYLDETPQLPPDFHLLFLVHFTRHLGFFPQTNFSTHTPYFELQEGVFTANNEEGFHFLSKQESALLAELMQTSFYDEKKLAVNRIERRQLMNSILKYYQFHISHFNLRSPEILETILG